jgi:hypothetical protein
VVETAARLFFFYRRVSRILAGTPRQRATTFGVRDHVPREIVHYDERILEALADHGLRPLPTTSPEFLRDAVRDLYLFEIRRLRGRLIAGAIARPDYAGHVIELRKRYMILSVPLARWTV